jgi:putative transcription factor
MEDECDICGRSSYNISKYRIEGAEVLACPSCGKHGTLVEDPNKTPQFNRKKEYGFNPIQKKTSQKSIQKPSQYHGKRNKEKTLIEDYGRIITSARTSFGLTREELAKNLFIRETFLTKIENEKQRPSDELAKKIEKTLNISLLVEKSDDINVSQYSSDTVKKETPMTLGDFARIKKKK